MADLENYSRFTDDLIRRDDFLIRVKARGNRDVSR